MAEVSIYPKLAVIGWVRYGARARGALGGEASHTAATRA